MKRKATEEEQRVIQAQVKGILEKVFNRDVDGMPLIERIASEVCGTCDGRGCPVCIPQGEPSADYFE